MINMGVCIMNSVIIVFFILPLSFAFPDQGQWSKTYEKEPTAYFGMHKSLYAGSSVSLSVNCEPYNPKEKVSIEIGWILRQTSCFEEYLSLDILKKEALKTFYECPMNRNGAEKVRYIKTKPILADCSSLIRLEFPNVSFVADNDIRNAVNSQCQLNYRSDILGVTSSNTNSDTQALFESKPSKVYRSKRIISEEMNESESNSYVNQNKPPESTTRLKKRETNVDSAGSPLNNSTDKAAQIKNAFDQQRIKPSEVKKKNFSMLDELQNVTQTPYNIAAPLNDVQSKVVKPALKLAVVDIDGVYLFVLKINSITGELINTTVDVTMKGDYGYLSAVDFPLLLFYGYMCGIYAVYAFAWLVVSALQWRDLLRIQFWIGGVILLGFTEKAVFYAEYTSINYTGQSVQGAVIFAEILSCLKRTLARMLVIIVSLGFGIVKPRLGPMLHRVVGVGTLYFILGAAEGSLRVLKPKNDPSNQALMAGIPLAVTDSAICWWIFSSLVQTNRTLRLRRNLVKLSLYRHFTNTLIFAVLASVAFMIWSIHSHKLVTCITDWKELWVDEAYWHLLFSLLLLVIMILWRPTNNNQRYAYTPLLDAMDDENDDEFDQALANDAFVGMKMRSSKNPAPANEKEFDEKQDDDLKWVEENVPSTFTENAVPSFLDSDEEIMTAKFERSKME